MRSTLNRVLRSKLALVSVLYLVPPGASSALAQISQDVRSPTLSDYYRMETVGSPAISPSGDRVAFVRTRIMEDKNRRHSEVWLVSTDGQPVPVRLTTPAFGASSPRWSPDGKILTFSSSRPGGSIWFLRMDRPAGEAFQIEGVDGSPIFSPDSRWIAFTKPTPPPPGDPKTYRSDFDRTIDERFEGRMYDWMNYRFDRRGYLDDPRDRQATPPQEIYVVPREGGTPRQLTHLGVDARGMAWSHDGRSLAFTADSHQRDEHTYERADLWVVDLDGDARRLTDDGYHYRNPSWSPDGRQIAVQGSAGLDMVIESGQSHGAPIDIYVIPVDGGQSRNITENWDLMAGAPQWSDGNLIYFSTGISGNTHLFRVSANRGGVEQLTDGDRQLRGFSLTRDFSRIAYQSTDPTHPSDIFTSAINGTQERRLTLSNADLLPHLKLSNAERVRFSSYDGTEVEGWVMRPTNFDPDGGPYPMVLSIHGGPHGAYGNNFSLRLQILAAEGYFVLFINPRGSTGYGEDFKWAIWGGWGVLDYQDLMAGVDYALEHYPIDTERMGVTGGSYGGFMTNWIIGHTQRFSAAVARASISNWMSDYGTADIPRTKESEFFGAPWEKQSRDLMIESSPITYAGNATTPTLFLHGELDHRVPIAEAEQMYVALKKQRVPAMFIRYPDSYHGGWTPWRTVHSWHYELEWWSKYLKEKPRI